MTSAEEMKVTGDLPLSDISQGQKDKHPVFLHMKNFHCFFLKKENGS